jgi:hypothetical protein
MSHVSGCAGKSLPRISSFARVCPVPGLIRVAPESLPEVAGRVERYSSGPRSNPSTPRNPVLFECCSMRVRVSFESRSCSGSVRFLFESCSSPVRVLFEWAWVMGQ